jgi:outer membrane protein assembly factor BamB
MKNLSIVMKHLSIVLLLVGFHVNSASAQMGLPPIKNYRPSDYQGGSGIWDIAQDKRGILYFASDEGLLSFDGHYWKRYPQPNKAAIKSLALDSSGRIYAGGQDQVGYFYPDAHGSLQYHSLSAALPEVARQFADIWDIIITPEGVLFRTVETLFFYSHGNMRTFDAPAGWMMIGSVGSRVFAVDKEQGLLEWKHQVWASPCPGHRRDSISQRYPAGQFLVQWFILIDGLRLETLPFRYGQAQ